MLDTGVYFILNTVNGKRYVGSAAKSLKVRWQKHRTELRAGKHRNRHLQFSWKKYGEVNFQFRIAEYCPPRFCLEREQWWIDRYKNTEAGVYNLCLIAGSSLGVKHDETARERMSASAKRRFSDPEERRRMGDLRKGVRLSEEERRKIGDRQRGKKRSPEAARRIAEKNRENWLGRKHTEETKAKISEAMKGRKHTEAWKEAMSRRLKGNRYAVGKRNAAGKRSAEFCAKRSAAMSGRVVPRETIEKQAVANRGRKRTPEQCQRIAEGVRRSHQNQEVRARIAAAAKVGWLKRKLNQSAGQTLT